MNVVMETSKPEAINGINVDDLMTLIAGVENEASGHGRCVRLVVGNGVRRMIANGHIRVRLGDCSDYWRSVGVPEEAGPRPLKKPTPMPQRPCPVGHTKIESTVRYLGFEVNDALVISEQADI